MCGVFGAVGEINCRILSEIACEAGKRGPHAWGASWYGDNMEISSMKGIGKIPPDPFGSVKSRMIVGNCRLSTSGSFLDVNNNQPMVVGDVVISHNGNVVGYKELIREYNLHVSTECDSEVIAHLIALIGVSATLDILNKGTPYSLIGLYRGSLFAYTNGQHLNYRSVNGATYFCSREFTWSSPVEQRTIMQFY